MGAEIDYQIDAPAEMRTPNLHRMGTSTNTPNGVHQLWALPGVAIRRVQVLLRSQRNPIFILAAHLVSIPYAAPDRFPPIPTACGTHQTLRKKRFRLRFISVPSHIPAISWTTPSGAIRFQVGYGPVRNLTAGLISWLAPSRTSARVTMPSETKKNPCVSARMDSALSLNRKASRASRNGRAITFRAGWM
jgi:hypothetical protein